jgi:hypothetical protein
MTQRPLVHATLGLVLFGAALAGACSAETQVLNSVETGGSAGTSAAGDGGSEPSAGTSGNQPTGGSSGSDAGRTGSDGGANGNSGGNSGGSAAAGGSGATGGGAAASGGAATGGDSATGGSQSTGGSAGTQGGIAGGPPLGPCSTSETTPCAPGSFCIPSQSEFCPADSTEGCSGLCAQIATPPICEGFAENVPCPKGYECLVDPGSASGTDPWSYCVESALACAMDEDCPAGFRCVEHAGSRACSPDKVVCYGSITCPAKPTACAPGFVHSIADECYGPCVPIHRCACSEDWECQREAASCDRVQGRCATPLAPAPRCLLPYDAGPCLASIRKFAFVEGECREVTYGNCEGNDNRFDSLEECLAYCKGMPNETACPEGRVPATICTVCGNSGGCGRYAEVCAQPCEETAECATPYFYCTSAGLCQADGCL